MRALGSLLCVLLVLCACSGTGGHRQSYNPQSYTVKTGDTLYLIAWKYKLDHRTLARWNHLQKPYVIYSGQKILIYPAGYTTAYKQTSSSFKKSKSKKYNRKTPKNYTVRSGDTLYSIARKFGVSVQALQQANNLSSSTTIYKGQQLNIRSSAVQIASTPSRSVQSSRRPKVPVFNKKSPPPKHWVWPTKGKVIATFKGSKSTQQGIDIAGVLNQPIYAVSAGTVVYQGKGLLRYGNTVIIKHNDTFLSAYAYNNAVMVKEGDKVNMGQLIAKMGRLGRNAPALHLEIRENGKAVNPLTYLPKN